MMSLKSTIVIGAGLIGLASLSGIGGYTIGRFSPSQPQLSSTRVTSESRSHLSSTQASARVAREVLSCVTTMAKVEVTQPTVSIFAKNDPNSKVIAQVDNHTFVMVLMEQKGWFLIRQPVEGWIQKKLTQSSCNEKVEMVKFGKQGGITAIADRFVGSGSHLYRVPLTEGAILTVTNTRGVLPVILNPEGGFLVEPEESQITWTGAIPKTGVYTLEMQSEHKGYRYAFTVSVK
jgi:hypothetical protein